MTEAKHPVDNLPAATPIKSTTATAAPLPERRPRWLLALTLALRGILLRLADRVVDAETAMGERAAGMAHTHIAGLLCRYGIPDLLNEGPLDAATLAAKTGTRAHALHRILRAAATSGVGNLLPDGRFCHNRLSRALCRDSAGGVKAFAMYFASPANSAAYGSLETALSSDEAPFTRANGLPLWQWLERHPGERELFTEMMAGMTRGEAPILAKLYPFEYVTRLCDLGGGQGTLLAELLRRYPHLQGVLYDRESMLAPARELFAQHGVKQRVELLSGDFFTAVPRGCDTYLLKNILHNWNDEDCLTILQNCRAAMRPGDRLLVAEVLVDWLDRHNFAAFRDLHMLVTLRGARERGRDDYRALLHRAGLTLCETYASPLIAILEARLK